MQQTIIILFYLAGLTGILSGGICGFSIREVIFENGESRKEKERRGNPLKKKRRKIFRLYLPSKGNDGKRRKKNLLSERVRENKSLIEFSCNASGEDPSEHIREARKTQDEKYTFLTTKKR